MAEAVVLTIDKGGTNTRVAAKSGERIGRIESYYTPRKYKQAVGHIAATSQVVLDGRRPDVIGISIAAKTKNGLLISGGQLQEYGYIGHNIGEDVADEMGVAHDRVVVLNDCRAGAKAEQTARQPKDGEAGAFMVLSTGFGGSPYTSGELIDDEPGHEDLKWSTNPAHITALT
jgi:predicted NBD/HSP70 family sugar kinase